MPNSFNRLLTDFINVYVDPYLHMALHTIYPSTPKSITLAECEKVNLKRPILLKRFTKFVNTP